MALEAKAVSQILESKRSDYVIGPSARMQVTDPNDNPGTTPELVRITGDVVFDSKDQPKSTYNKGPNYRGHGISGVEDENGPGHSRLEKNTNDVPGLRQVETAS